MGQENNKTMGFNIKKLIKPVAGILIVGAAAGAVAWYMLSPEPAEVCYADRGEVSPTVSAIGNVMGDKKVTIYANVAGTVDQKNAIAGDRVSAGDTLLTYTGTDQRREVELAQTDVEYSKKILKAIADNRAEHQNKYDEAKALDRQLSDEFAHVAENIRALDVDRFKGDFNKKRDENNYQDDILELQKELASIQDSLAESELDLKERELTEDQDVEDDVADAQGYSGDLYDINSRIIDLQKDQLMLPQEGMSPKAYNLYTKYQQQLENISRRWAQAKTDMATEEALVTAYSEVRGGEAQVAKNRLALKKANEELEKAELGALAPADGIITECFVDSGAVVQQGSEIFEMQTDNRYKIRLLISRFDIGSIKKGQRAEISIGKKTYEGEVIDIGANATDDISGKPKARVDVLIKSKKDQIIGLESDVVIYLKPKTDVIRVPADCVYTDDDGSYTFVSVDGKVEKRYIKAGVSDEFYTQVKEGIEEGEHIVSDPNAINLEGEKIKEEPKVEEANDKEEVNSEETKDAGDK